MWRKLLCATRGYKHKNSLDPTYLKKQHLLETNSLLLVLLRSPLPAILLSDLFCKEVQNSSVQRRKSIKTELYSTENAL